MLLYTCKEKEQQPEREVEKKMDIYEKDCKKISNMEIMLAKQIVEECEKEFNISLYDMSYPISANLHNMYSNKKETMKMASTVIRKRDGNFCYCTKIMVFDKIKNIEKITYHFVENVDPKTAQPIGKNYKLLQSFKEVKKCD